MENIQNNFDENLETFISEISSIVDNSTSLDINREISNVTWDSMFMDMGDIQYGKYKR